MRTALLGLGLGQIGHELTILPLTAGLEQLDALQGAEGAAGAAQRLVRNLCPNCAEPYQPSDALLARLPGAASLAGVQFRRPKGCSACRGTGYRGRASIAEIMMISDDIRELILRRAPEKDIRNQAMAEGMIPLLADGLRRAAAGLTSVEDVIRVAGLE
jgi:type II secretory ATPase GspE/PulE/Tfp pilus assembly ATPase PilB-like protein